MFCTQGPFGGDGSSGLQPAKVHLLEKFLLQLDVERGRFLVVQQPSFLPRGFSPMKEEDIMTGNYQFATALSMKK
jgi:hypothetical protein